MPRLHWGLGVWADLFLECLKVSYLLHLQKVPVPGYPWSIKPVHM